MTQKVTGNLSPLPDDLGALRPDEVRVFSLDAGSEGLLAAAYPVLTRAELTRADGFRRDSSRSQMARLEFIVGRGWLRLLLASTLNAENRIAAADLPIETGAQGKPFVDRRSPALTGLPEFNVAHSRGQVMIALSQAGSVGVDLEFVDDTVEVLEIARESFAPAEIAAIEQAAAGQARVDAFYRCWTAKEAIAKADGRGLSLALDSFSVLDGVADLCSLSAPVPAGGAAKYFVRSLTCPPGYRAALATLTPEVVCSGTQIESYDGVIRCRAMHPQQSSDLTLFGNVSQVTERAIHVPGSGIALETCTI
jgi:4'-phosphopantetheinyl transferase